MPLPRPANWWSRIPVNEGYSFIAECGTCGESITHPSTYTDGVWKHTDAAKEADHPANVQDGTNFRFTKDGSHPKWKKN